MAAVYAADAFPVRDSEEFSTASVELTNFAQCNSKLGITPGLRRPTSGGHARVPERIA